MHLSFQLQKTSDVFIALNSSSDEIPEWLRSYDKTPLVLENDDDTQPFYNLYSKRIEENTIINLKGMQTETSGLSMYSVFVVPVSSLNSSSDQREVKKYESEEAILKGPGLKTAMDNNRGFIELTNRLKNIIEWKFTVGLASDYEIAFKHNNPTGIPIPASLKVFTADGILMHSEILEFPATGERWRTIKTKTESDINAGTYTLQLGFEGQKGIRIDYLSVQ
jgi:hypothetical protein